MQIKNRMRYHLTPICEVVKTQEIINVGEAVEEKKPQYTLMEIRLIYTLCKVAWKFPKK